MKDSATQLSDAMTAQFVAIRGAVEAILNRVTAIVTEEQVERLKLQEQVDEVLRRLTELEHHASAAANEQRAHIMAQLGRLEERPSERASGE